MKWPMTTNHLARPARRTAHPSPPRPSTLSSIAAAWSSASDAANWRIIGRRERKRETAAPRRAAHWSAHAAHSDSGGMGRQRAQRGADCGRRRARARGEERREERRARRRAADSCDRSFELSADLKTSLSRSPSVSRPSRSRRLNPRAAAAKWPALSPGRCTVNGGRHHQTPPLTAECSLCCGCRVTTGRKATGWHTEEAQRDT